MQKIEKVRVNLEGEREFYVKWTGYHRGHNCWEPEANLLDKALVRRFLARATTPAAARNAGPMPSAPAIAAPDMRRSKRACSAAAAAKTRRDAAVGGSSDEDEASEEDVPAARKLGQPCDDGGSVARPRPKAGKARRGAGPPSSHAAKKQCVP